MSTQRREFLKQSAAALSSSAWLAGSAWSQADSGADHGASQPTVAAIGVGGSQGRYNRGGTVARQAARFGRMVAVCDVVDRHNDEFNTAFDGKLKTYRDYRRLLDEVRPSVVTIGTPDHWHVPIAIAAMQSGADVYCEKPLTLTINEGKEIRSVVESTGRIFQVGTQQRSEFGQRFLKAVAMVRSGRLGDNVRATVAIGKAPGDGPFEATAVPEGMDWDRWVGPAPAVDYCEERRKMFRWWFEYSGGKMTDWGAHHIDIAQWALGMENTGPKSVEARSGSFPDIVPDDMDWAAFLNGQRTLPNGYNTATGFSIDLTFANGATISVNDHYDRDERTRFGNGVLFEGDKGRIFVNRDRLSGKPAEELTESDEQALQQEIVKLCKGKQPGNHMGNFFECLEDRSVPISDVWTHHRIMTSCHLCNIALMTQRKLSWDPENEQFVGDDRANALLERERRSDYL